MASGDGAVTGVVDSKGSWAAQGVDVMSESLVRGPLAVLPINLGVVHCFFGPAFGLRAATAACSASLAQGAISPGDSSASSGGVW
jgi:hypothetical protein